MKLENPLDSTEQQEDSATVEPSESEVKASTASTETRSALRKSRRKRRLIRLSAILGGAALLLAGAGSYYFLGTVNVPAAASHYSKLSNTDPCGPFDGLIPDCSVSFEHSESVARDGLISQTPAPGFSITKQSSVKLLYSSGPSKAEFPDILRQNYDEALKELYLVGVEIGEVKMVEKDDLGPNRIISASIKPGTITRSGTKVDLEVSTETVALPDLKGLTREQAELDLEKLGFEVEITEESSLEPVGTVVSQAPAPGAVAKGSKVSVKIAKAEEVKSLKVPAVVGMTEEEAQSVIASAGFKNIAVVKVESSKVTDARVSHVAPGEGRTIRSDSNVVIVVSIPEAKPAS